MNDILYGVAKDGKFGYINESGEVVWPLVHDDFKLFKNGLGVLRKEDYLLVVNAQSEVVLNIRIPDISIKFSVSNGLLVVAEKGAPFRNGVLRLDGSWAIEFGALDGNINSPFVHDVAVAKKQQSGRGLIDVSGRWLCDPVFVQIFPFSDDTKTTVARTHEEGNRHCILIDTYGNQVGRDRYSMGYGGTQGLIPVAREEKFGMVNEAGDLILPFSFDYLAPFHEELAIARNFEGNYGATDLSGNWAIHPKFSFIGSFSGGLAPAEIKASDGSYTNGYIDRKGDWVIQPNFYNADPFFLQGSLAWVSVIIDGIECAGYINRQGEYVWPPSKAMPVHRMSH